MSKFEIIEEVTKRLLKRERDKAKNIIVSEYPFIKSEIFSRNYSLAQKMEVFMRDGFIDRYSGERLVIPGILKILSQYFPDEFPYHKNWKLSECHIAYWELSPTVDHIYPICLGGKDEESNWVTTSMLNNSIKSNWTLEQMRWNLYDKGDVLKWDGLTNRFIHLVEMDTQLLQDTYIKNWYRVAVKYRQQEEN